MTTDGPGKLHGALDDEVEDLVADRSQYAPELPFEWMVRIEYGACQEIEVSSVDPELFSMESTRRCDGGAQQREEIPQIMEERPSKRSQY